MDILSKQEVIDTIEGKASPKRVPVLLKMWSSSNLYQGKEFEQANQVMNAYPDDIAIVGLNNQMYIKERKSTAYDNDVQLENFEEVDRFIEMNIQKHESLEYIESPEENNNPRLKDRYKLLCQWYFLFENLWRIRGMTNALVDFYDYPEEVHKLFRAITNYYKGIIGRAKKEKNIDGFFVTDDIGTQTDIFFSIDVFKEFFYPYYKEIADYCHSLGVHFWLHTCGNITKFLPMLIELGLDVIHPIQRYSMDEIETFETYKNQICFWYGLDVQKTIPFGSAQDVEQEIKRVYDIFSKANGRFMFTCGNGLTPDCPIESFVKLYETSHIYNPYVDHNDSVAVI